MFGELISSLQFEFGTFIESSHSIPSQRFTIFVMALTFLNLIGRTLTSNLLTMEEVGKLLQIKVARSFKHTGNS
jgi:hypothetical protein